MQTFGTGNGPFIDRRQGTRDLANASGSERRQFSDSRSSTRPEVNELAVAVDEYKMINRRRFITIEELYDVMISLGYHK